MSVPTELPIFQSGAEPPVPLPRGGVGSLPPGANRAGGVSTTTEADAPEADILSEKPGWGTVDTGVGQSQRVVGKTGRPPVPGPKTGDGKSPWTATATVEGTTPPDVAYGIAAREKRIHDAETLQHLVDMRASGASEQQMMAWAQLNDSDAESAQLVAQEHFPRMREKIRKLQQDVDDARSMKINPFHWHESIGRGGRVAAAFAALTGGFAAGKTNPNTAIKMMESAIERDIAAQQQNIRTTFEALKTQKGMLADERALYDEQLNSINQIRAIKYAGVVAQLQAAKQHAVTEAHHLAIQTSEDHFELKLLQAIAAAEKEVLRLELDGPLRNAQQLSAYKQQIAQYQEMLQSGPRGGITVPTEKVSTLTGDTVGQRPEATIQMAAAPSRAASVAARGPRMGQGTGRGPQGRETAAGAIPEGAVAQDAQGQYLDAQGNVIQPEPRMPAEDRRPLTKKAVEDPDIQLPKHVAREGGFARTISKDINESVAGLTTLDQADEDIKAGRPIRNGGLGDARDAEVVAASIEYPDPAMYKGGENNIDYLREKQRVDFVKGFPESLERPTKAGEERNTIRVGNMTYTLQAGSRDPKTYERVRGEAVKAVRLVDGLNNMARIIKQKGLSGIFTDEGGINIPGINTSDPATLKMFNYAIAQAMGFIKQHDPTARISDQDLKVGEKAATPYMTKTDAAIDFVQSLWKGPQDNTKREQIGRFLGALAVEAATTLMYEISNEVVPSYNTLLEQKKITEEVSQFTRQAQSE